MAATLSPSNAQQWLQGLPMVREAGWCLLRVPGRILNSGGLEMLRRPSTFLRIATATKCAVGPLVYLFFVFCFE